MYSKFIKLIVIRSILVCCGFAGRVLNGRFPQLCRTRERSTSHPPPPFFLAPLLLEWKAGFCSFGSCIVQTLSDITADLLMLLLVDGGCKSKWRRILPRVCDKSGNALLGLLSGMELVSTAVCGRFFCTTCKETQLSVGTRNTQLGAFIFPTVTLGVNLAPSMFIFRTSSKGPITE